MHKTKLFFINCTVEYWIIFSEINRYQWFFGLTNMYWVPEIRVFWKVGSGSAHKRFSAGTQVHVCTMYIVLYSSIQGYYLVFPTTHDCVHLFRGCVNLIHINLEICNLNEYIQPIIKKINDCKLSNFYLVLYWGRINTEMISLIFLKT